MPPPLNTFNPTSHPYAPQREPYRPAIYPDERVPYGISQSQRHYYSPESYVRAEATAPAPAPSTEPRLAQHNSSWPPWDFSIVSPHSFGPAAGPARPSHLNWSSSPPVADRAGYAERAGILKPRITSTASHCLLPSFREFEQGVSPWRGSERRSPFERLFPSPPRQTQNIEPTQQDVQLFSEHSPRYHTSEISTPPSQIQTIPSLSPASNLAHHPQDYANAIPSPSTPSLPSSSSSSSSSATVTATATATPHHHPPTRGPVKIPVAFETITAHTAKCDLCNGRNRQRMTRCRACGWQCCQACARKNGASRTHVFAGGSRVHIASSSPSSSSSSSGTDSNSDGDKDASTSDSNRSSRVGGVRPRLVGEAVAVTRRQTRSWTRRNAARVADAAIAAAAVGAFGASAVSAPASRSGTRSESETPAREFSIQGGPSEETSVTLSLGVSNSVYGGEAVTRVSSDVMDGARSLYDLSISALCRRSG